LLPTGPSTFLSASLDGTIREWDIAYSESKSLFSLQESGADSPPPLRRHAKIHAMHFDGENTIFAARSDGKVTVWDYNSEAPISTVQVMESSLFGLDKAGDVLVSSGSDKVVSLFSLVPANRP
jgi:WD40 repeat protein